MADVNFPERPDYIDAYERLAFGMFVHYGLYSSLGIGEWTYWMTDRNMDRYKKLADNFTASGFDADDLVLTAKRAGCKYVSLTTRHHDGFSLYDTRGLSTFDSLHAPAKRDLIEEFVEACAKHDMVPFLYHTTWDWYNKDFDNDFNGYLEYLRQSVEVLCRNYGKVGGFFFDGNWIKRHADWKLDELYGTIRKYQPEAIIVNNTGLNAKGETGHPELDVATFEQGNSHPIDRDGLKRYFSSEVCMTLNDHWGYAKYDYNYKSPRELIYTLCKCRKDGANFLLNISPDDTGAVIPYQRSLMSMIGDWLKVFGEAIYDVEPPVYPDDIHTFADGCFILKARDGGKLYIFNCGLGENGDTNVTVSGNYEGVMAFSNVNFPVKSIKWMDNGEELAFDQNEGRLTVDFTGYKYGYNYCVRVAVAELE